MNSSEITNFIEITKNCKILPLHSLKLLCTKAKQIFETQPNIVVVRAPIFICGDIHGQFSDLIQLFQIGGNVPSTSYLFMGDYVDRGHHGVEVITHLLALKVKYPKRITLLRGNHESRTITMNYGFYDECNKKYGTVQAWKIFNELFDFFPLTALVQNQILCMHGGLSPSSANLDDIDKINRKKQIPNSNCLMSDLLWSDPYEKAGYRESPRGLGYLFGQDITEQFIHKNQLKMIARAHQMIMKGYEKTHNDHLVTIFSAPNYCYMCGNQAGIMEIDQYQSISYQSFEQSLNQKSGSTSKRIPDYFL